MSQRSKTKVSGSLMLLCPSVGTMKLPWDTPGPLS